ncbi:hypothetical protein VTO73DRAFT_6309 [Trametes versicolor]
MRGDVQPNAAVLRLVSCAAFYIILGLLAITGGALSSQSRECQLLPPQSSVPTAREAHTWLPQRVRTTSHRPPRAKFDSSGARGRSVAPSP